jgi:uncharacterized protein YdaU (DUF1376 family)
MSLPYYPMYPRDFFEGTQEMSLELKGAYIMVLNLMYTRGGPVSDEPGFLSRYVGCSVRKWKQVRDELVAMGKLHVQHGMISNSRADEVLEKQRTYQDKQAENRARPNKNNAEETPARTTRAKSEPDTEPKIDADEKRAPVNRYEEISEDFLDLLETNCRKWASGSLKETAGPMVLAYMVRLLRPASGVPCTMEDVRHGIVKAAESLNRRGEKVNLAYFEKPILQARDERLRPNPEPEISHERAGQSQSGRNSHGRGGDRPRAGGKHGASAYGVALERMFGGDQEAIDVPYEPIDGRSERVA